MDTKTRRLAHYVATEPPADHVRVLDKEVAVDGNRERYRIDIYRDAEGIYYWVIAYHHRPRPAHWNGRWTCNSRDYGALGDCDTVRACLRMAESFVGYGRKRGQGYDPLRDRYGIVTWNVARESQTLGDVS